MTEQLGFDGFPLQADAVDRAIEALLVEANATAHAEETAAAFENRIMKLLPQLADHVALWRAAARRLRYYQGRSVGWRSLQTVRRLCEATLIEVRSQLDDADLVVALEVASLPRLSWKTGADDVAVVEAIVTRAQARDLSPVLRAALESFALNLKDHFSRALRGRVEALLGRPPAVEVSALPLAAIDCVLENVAHGYSGPLDIYTTVIESFGKDLALEDKQPDAPLANAIWECIDKAFAAKERAAQAWPAVTDADRITQAFERIRARGIIALEYAGFTQKDAQARAIDLSLAREAAGFSDLGYCAFTAQDVGHGDEHVGMMLAYSALVQPEDEVATQVAQIVVAECRDAGLEVEWNGDVGVRINLPNVVWQRRGRRTTPSELELFKASWNVELAMSQWTVEEALDELEAMVAHWFGEHVDFGRAQLAALEKYTRDSLARAAEQERAWTEPTVNDRLAAAFAALGARDVLALHSNGLNIQDGWGYVRSARTAAHRGAVFYHGEDVIDCLEGRGLRLAFGSFEVDRAANDQATRALGDQVISTLREHGVAVQWSGLVTERIEIAPFEWRERHSTKAPPIARQPGGGNERVRSIPFDPAWRGEIIARGLALVAEAPRNARIDLRCSRALRAAWKQVSGTDDGHACTIGRPMVFTRAREHLTLGAMSARENIREEAVAYYSPGPKQ